MVDEMRIDSGPIDAAMRKRAEALAIPGVVAMAATGSELIYQGAFGRRDLGKPAPMTPDSVFWIASMTKAVTAVAAMQLVEQGRLTLDAPIGTVLPELADPQVLEGFATDGTPLLRPAARPITLRHLLTHTSGFCYDMWNAELLRYRNFAKLPSARSGKYAGILTPIMTDPGTRWEYGTSLDFAGRAVEAASGKTLEAYLRDHIFAPLGMDDTAFRIGPSQRERLVGVHARGPDGALKPIAFEIEQNPEYHAGGGGLYGTAPDYVKFMQMILNRGAGNGHRLLQAETVALMGENHIGDLAVTKMNSAIAFATNDLELFPGIDKKWGLAGLINMANTPEGRSPGSLSWAGLANTYYWIDPARDLCGVILMQVLPFADAPCLDAFAAFERGVYAGLDANQRAA
uniref:Beta-lactamase n=1 Tax=Rhodopseudomonas palustris (strain BisA53) TaxID=316055 RepID=Q07V55_RHOP5